MCFAGNPHGGGRTHWTTCWWLLRAGHARRSWVIARLGVDLLHDKLLGLLRLLRLVLLLLVDLVRLRR